MNVPGVIGGLLLVVAGLIAVIGVARNKRVPTSNLAFLTDEWTGAFDVEDDPVPVEGEAMDPLVERLLGPVARQLTQRLRSLYPSTRLDRIHTKLLHAGLSNSLRAEEFATIQLLVAVVGVSLGLAFFALGGGSVLLRFLVVTFAVAIALLGPGALLGGRAKDRSLRIQHDLPDMLDLLTISVEAGLGLEAAMDTASSDLDSPLSEEMARTLQEMSLGLSRHQALENLKTRTDAQDLKTFVLVLSQADVLGMPIGRVLRTQADEMRDRRRARAREQAAKLPVKILFPLMLFILPPLMILVLGPAVLGIAKAFP